MAWHARKSASGSKQWIRCPGSLPYVEGLPEGMRRPAGAAAMLGTCAHGLGEHCLRNGLRQVPDALLDTVIWLDENEDAHLTQEQLPGIETTSQLSAELNGFEVKFMARVDEKMASGVQLYLDVCWEAYDEMGPGTEMMVEETFDMDWLRPGLGGTSDCTLWQFLSLLKVIDYKNGYVAVAADDNTQAMSYGLGMAQRVDWMFEELEVIIVQPNSRGERVKRWRISRADLETFRDRLAEASDRVDEAADAYKLIADSVDFMEWAGTYLCADPDGSHCTFCDGLATCPAAIARAEAEALADFADDPPDDNPLEVHDDASLERLARVVRWGPFLDKLVKAANTLGQRRLEQGLDMPGFKLVEGKTNRRWVSTDKEVAALILGHEEVKGKLTDADLFEEPKPPALKSPAQMEKVGPARSAVRKKVKELVAELAAKPPGKVTMAPESDPREAVEPTSAADDFVDDVEWSPEGDEE